MKALAAVDFVGAPLVDAQGSDKAARSRHCRRAGPARDLVKAKARVAETGKRILLDVAGEWRISRHILGDYLARNQDVGDAFAAAFVIAKINWSPDNRNEALLASHSNVSGYPHFFILDDAGRLLQS